MTVVLHSLPLFLSRAHLCSRKNSNTTPNHSNKKKKKKIQVINQLSCYQANLLPSHQGKGHATNHFLTSFVRSFRASLVLNTSLLPPRTNIGKWAHCVGGSEDRVGGSHCFANFYYLKDEEIRIYNSR